MSEKIPLFKRYGYPKLFYKAKEKKLERCCSNDIASSTLFTLLTSITQVLFCLLNFVSPAFL